MGKKTQKDDGDDSDNLHNEHDTKLDGDVDISFQAQELVKVDMNQSHSDWDILSKQHSVDQQLCLTIVLKSTNLHLSTECIEQRNQLKIHLSELMLRFLSPDM